MLNYKELEKMLERNNQVPYPSIPKLYQNKRYANLLYDDFSGELSAVTQYIYEHIDLKEQVELKKILLTIAIQEMKHLNIIGELLVELGEKPYYQNSNNEQWTAKNVKYNIENLKELMEFNIGEENIAIDGYKKAMMYTKDMRLKKVFSRIILDEKVHIEVFSYIKDNIY